ncbi:MAG: AhpC/TSA family protein [Gammaproteobacteria bacterium]|nr:AhpC/TSA family protein [Gammaproteobacteria bacterium]NNJ49298.1 AhpC/TSA family protein [Gammaproteobacteria bacterium]
MDQPEIHKSLSHKIQAFQDQLLPTIPQETLNTLIQELHGLVAKGIAEQALNKGDKFPSFNLPSANDETRSLSDFLSNGPLIISFYRGAWCPYCNLEINALQQRLPQIKATGAQLVAISPQLPDKSADQVNNSHLTFEVLSDTGNLLAKACGLVFTLPEPLRPIYEAWEINIPDHNGDNSFELPIPASYIVDTTGKVRFAHVDMDYTKRLEPNIIIEQLTNI